MEKHFYPIDENNSADDKYDKNTDTI